MYLTYTVMPIRYIIEHIDYTMNIKLLGNIGYMIQL